MIYIIDIDGTICTNTNGDYDKVQPHLKRIEKCNQLYEDGHYIIYWTARGMCRAKGITSRAYEMFYNLTKDNLIEWGAKHHELRLGKPHYDVWVDDKAFNSGAFFEDLEEE